MMQEQKTNLEKIINSFMDEISQKISHYYIIQGKEKKVPQRNGSK